MWQAGGFPVVMPTLSVGETYVRPSTLMYRNLLAMDVEEILRSHPIDGAVLLGGCDKTTPGLVMGAASMDIPAIFVPAGAMLRGHWRGQQLQGTGSSTLAGARRLSRGPARREDVAAGRRGDGAIARDLQHHGHRVDHDEPRRRARPYAARRELDSRGRLDAFADGVAVGPPHRGDGLGGLASAAGS